MYKCYAQVMSISYTLMKLAAVPCLLFLQLSLYNYFCQFLSNFELCCQSKHLLLQYMSVFVLAFIFDVGFQ